MGSITELMNDEQHDGNGWLVVDEPSPQLVSERTQIQGSLDLGVLLLSWMIVLLRVQDDGQVAFEWSLAAPDCDSISTVVPFSSNEVVHSLDLSIADAKARISKHIDSVRQAEDESATLLVSTRSLSRAPKQYGEDVSRATWIPRRQSG